MPTKDKVKINAYNKQWYYDRGGKAKRRAASKTWIQKNREWLTELKATLVCIRCGEGHPAALDFHHLDPSTKEFTIARAIAQMAISRIQAEIAKCLVLCANCHRKEHYSERNTQEADGQQTVL